ncbi:hypothetical protein [Streptomyces wuyuanensis]|uniref:hypothetical protein n=1 Tax=Streptomyces wuyuanensis TaxID=1196353 RepID=UPI00342FCADA
MGEIEGRGQLARVPGTMRSGSHVLEDLVALTTAAACCGWWGLGVDLDGEAADVLAVQGVLNWLGSPDSARLVSAYT